MRYVMARYDNDRRERAYRIYISDSLKVMGNLNIRYIDMLKGNSVSDADPEEIKQRICDKLEQLGKEQKDGCI